MLYCHFPTKSYDQLQCDTYSPILGFYHHTMGKVPSTVVEQAYMLRIKRSLRGQVLCPSCIINGPGDGLSGPMYKNPIHIIDHLVKTTGCYQVINGQKLDVENQACYD